MSIFLERIKASLSRVKAGKDYVLSIPGSKSSLMSVKDAFADRKDIKVVHVPSCPEGGHVSMIQLHMIPTQE